MRDFKIMSQEVCNSCSGTKNVQTCVYCKKQVCKKCYEFVSEEEFSMYPKIPKSLVFGPVCTDCIIDKIQPERQIYEELCDKAKEVYFLTKNYRGNVRILARHTKRVAVEDVPDRREAILRMAFMAAQLNFNAIIEAEIKDKKTRTSDGYQSTLWSGSAMPAKVDGEHLELASLKGL